MLSRAELDSLAEELIDPANPNAREAVAEALSGRKDAVAAAILLKGGLAERTKGFDRTLLKEAAWEVVFSLDLEEDSVARLERDLLPYLSLEDEQEARRLEAADGAAWETLYVALAIKERKLLEEKLGEERTGRAGAALLACEWDPRKGWDPRLIEAMRSPAPKVRRSVFIGLERLADRLGRSKEIPEGFRALVDAGLDDADPVVRRACTALAIRGGAGAQRVLEIAKRTLTGPAEPDDAWVQVLMHSRDPEVLKALVPHLSRADLTIPHQAAARLVQVADEPLAREALSVLLSRDRASWARTGGQACLCLRRIVQKFPDQLSDIEVFRVSLYANSCLNDVPKLRHRLLHHSLRGPALADAMIAALVDKQATPGELYKAIERYFAQVGPEGWQKLARSWLRLDSRTRRRLVGKIATADKEGRFRKWLTEAVEDPSQTGALCMAVTHNHDLCNDREKLAPIPIPDLREKALGLAASGQNDLGRAAFQSLAFLKPDEALAVWKALDAHFPDGGRWSPLLDCGSDRILKANLALAAPLFRKSVAIGNTGVALRALRVLNTEEVRQVRDVLFGLLDGNQPLREAAFGKLVPAGDIEALRELAGLVLAGKSVTRNELRLLREPEHEAVRVWIDRTDFWEKAALTRQGFAVAGEALIRGRGVGFLARILDAGHLNGEEGKLADLAIRLFERKSVPLSLPHPRFVAAYLARCARPDSGFGGGPAPEGLKTLARARDSYTACLALRLLPRFDDGNVELRKHVASEKPWVALNAVAGLAHFRDPADAPALAKALDHPHPPVRAVAAWLIGSTSARDRYGERLARTALDKEQQDLVRAAAVHGAPLPVQDIVELIGDGDPAIALAAICKVVDMRRPALGVALSRRAKRPCRTKADREVRAAAALAVRTHERQKANAPISERVGKRASKAGHLARLVRWLLGDAIGGPSAASPTARIPEPK
jgi:hypothetical protein